jgi:hypothetical protein
MKYTGGSAMRKIDRKIFVILLIFISFYIQSTLAASDSSPKIEWQKSLGGSQNEISNSIQQTKDGGYIIGGFSNFTDGDVSGNHGSDDYWIVKLDPIGNIQWQKSLGGSGDDRGASIHETSEGGYIVAGSSDSHDGDVTGNHGVLEDYWVVKLDATGNIEWQKSLGGSGQDFTGDYLLGNTQQTDDGGYVVVGTSGSDDGDVRGNHGRWDYWVVKLDPSGNIQWQKSLGGSGDDEGASVQQTKDGGYIIGGTSRSNDGDVSQHHGRNQPAGTYLFSDYWIVKLDPSGNIQWQKSLGGSEADELNSIQQTKDGGYIAAGTSRSYDGDVTGNHGAQDYWIVKLDSGGNIQWQKSLGGSHSDFNGGIQQTNDGGYIVAGTSHSNDGDVTGNHNNSGDYWVVKLDASGNIQWQKSLGGSWYDQSESIYQTTDGGYVITGWSNSKDGDVTGNHGGWDYWVVKLSPTDTTFNNSKEDKFVKPLPSEENQMPNQKIKENQIPILTILDAKMVSPNELGIALKVRYPENCPSTAKRWITFEASINGKSVKKSIDVTSYTEPGKEWEGSGTRNLMSDTYGNVQPTTPLRINFEEESVPRFSNNVEFAFQATASYQGGESSNPSSIPVKILLPVVVLHGYKDKIGEIEVMGYPEGNNVGPSSGLFSDFMSRILHLRDIAFKSAYQELSENLIQNGYNKEKNWGFIYKFPFTFIFNEKRYVTLWDPQDSDIGYSSPSFATTNDLDGDFTRILDLVKKHSYADRMNIIGHSTGGLVARYWSSQKPAFINKVITVGTPHEGIARFYEEPFLEQYKNREDFERMRLMTEPGGNTPNLISWFVPKWDAIDQSKYKLTSSDPNPYFTNTFDYQYSPEVNYYLIYGMYRQPSDDSTPYNVVIDIRNDKQWYNLKGTNNRNGDEYIFWESAANKNGPIKSNINRISIDNLIRPHGDMMNDPQVIDEIKKILND